MLLRLGILIFFVAFAGNVNADTEEEKERHDRDRHVLTLTELMSTKPNPDVNKNGIGIFVYNGINSMDALGPLQVFKTAGLKAFLVAKQKGEITANNGLKFQVDKSIDEVTQLDILLVPGGAMETAMETMDPVTLGWIRQIDQNTIYTTSVCTGAWILGATGLLEGKKATTNWYRAKEILGKYGAEFKQERYVIDGKYITSAGVTAGLDMSLKIVNMLYGKDYTQAVMLDLEYDPQPPIKGGSVKNTSKDVFSVMREMYDYFLLGFVNSIP